jgi:chromate transporter
MVADRQEAAAPITVRTLFVVFLQIALASFGGALVWARRELVDRRRWLTNRDFAELIGVCQVLPGGNVLNLAICFGDRTRGLVGAVAALAGLTLVPFLMFNLLGILYNQGGQLSFLQEGLRGAASVMVGLMLSNGIKLGLPYRREPAAMLIALASFVAVGLLHLPLIPVVLVLGPISIGLAWRQAR